MKILGIAANFLNTGEERPPVPQWQNVFIKASSSLHRGNTFTYPGFSVRVPALSPPERRADVVEVPALSVVEAPALSVVEAPALSVVEAPALSVVEAPALSVVEAPALSVVEVWHEMELVVKLSRKLKNASLEAADEAYDEIALGMDWTAKDIQNDYKSKGWSWAIAKGFDQATMVSDFYPRNHFGHPEELDLRFDVNGKTAEAGNTRDLKIPIPHIIQFASQCMTLHPGDLIMTGAPPSPGPVRHGDICKGYINQSCLLDFKVI